MSSTWLCHAYGSGIRQQSVSVGWQNYCWDGYSFFPTYGYQGWVNDSFCVNTPSMLNTHSTYDHTNYYPGHESVFHWDFFCYCDCFCGIICHRFYDPCGNLVTNYSYWYNASPPPTYYSQTWFWVGWGINNTSLDEIYINGRYCSCVTTGTTGLPSFTDYSCVCCLDVCRLCHVYTPGYVWVEGENIWFISGLCWQNCIKHDGSSTFVGTAHAGSIWVGTGNYLEYVDCSGYKRKTHVGDPYGVDGGTHYCCCDVGSGNKGFFWDRDNWAFLYFINCSGKMIRLGNGFIYGNGP